MLITFNALTCGVYRSSNRPVLNCRFLLKILHMFIRWSTGKHDVLHRVKALAVLKFMLKFINVHQYLFTETLHYSTVFNGMLNSVPYKEKENTGDDSRSARPTLTCCEFSIAKLGNMVPL